MWAHIPETGCNHLGYTVSFGSYLDATMSEQGAQVGVNACHTQCYEESSVHISPQTMQAQSEHTRAVFKHSEHAMYFSEQ